MRDAPGLKAETIVAPQDGFIADVDSLAVADAALRLGAGRARLTDVIDPLAGVELLVRHGDSVHKGDPLARLYAKNRADCLPEAGAIMRTAFTFAETRPAERPLIRASI